MGFGIFLCHAEIKNMRIKNKTFFRNFKVIDLVMFFCIKDMLIVSCQPFSQMDIITVAAKTFPVVRSNLNCTFFYFFKNPFIGKNHFLFFLCLPKALANMVPGFSNSIHPPLPTGRQACVALLYYIPLLSQRYKSRGV